jgi:hypothetical protein
VLTLADPLPSAAATLMTIGLAVRSRRVEKSHRRTACQEQGEISNDPACCKILQQRYRLDV